MANSGNADIELDRAVDAAIPELDRLRDAAEGTPIYVVGGAVRDLLLGRSRTDVDVVVEGAAGEVARRLGEEVASHERFATAKARLGEVEIDLATARAETYPRPGALPEVRPAGIDEDLARRDFTINAMAIPLLDEPRLIDPHGGQADLEAGLLRVLHDRSFADDPTRALRAARYAARFDFALEPHTEELLREADLGTVSEDRIEAELLRIAAEPQAARGLALVIDWGLLQPRPEAAELVTAVDALLSSAPWSEIAERPRALIAAAFGPPGREAELAGVEPARPSQGVDAARGASPSELVLARAMGAPWLDDYVSSWRGVTLEIRGDDLIEAGIPEGPLVGKGLTEALRRKLDGEISGREEELRVALEEARAEG
jgi:tRNA nucleotidyltransferase (CCA-adding enzyme)